MAVYMIFEYGKRFRCAPSFNNLVVLLVLNSYTPAIQSRIEIVSGTCLLEAYVYIIMPRVIRVTAKCFNVECCRPRTNFSVMRDAVKDP